MPIRLLSDVKGNTYKYNENTFSNQYGTGNQWWASLRGPVTALQITSYFFDNSLQK
jgi:hypothetical protein